MNQDSFENYFEVFSFDLKMADSVVAHASLSCQLE